ncbi:MAG: DUF3299 domain-containing protein [Verrucomicrobiae bacterium]|nr:DUF3299 domain-containing protein [Verrucomicrobiae bacterium]
MIRATAPTEFMRSLAFITIWMLLLVGGAGAADGPREITWQNLIAPVAAEIDDPFAKLTGEQLMQLARVARFRQLLEEKKIPADGPSAEEEKRSVAELTGQGIDVDWLLSQRERVTRERTERAGQVDQQLAGARIRIPGYVLPLAFNDHRKITEFLLVPWVGACIHTPPAPPNQMIHVSVPGGAEPKGHFSPVWLEGALELKPASYNLFLVDGTRSVNVAFTMVAERITDYSATESESLAQVEIPKDAFKGHGWFQSWQMKVSLVFTRAMSGLRDDGTSKAFWFAILVAFGYGLVHTLGPGHGKAVVVSYFVGDGGSFRKGITMGVMIAVFHVLSSIIVVLVADFAVRQATGQAPSDYRAIRLGSYGLIILIGGVLLHRAIQAARRSRKSGESNADEHAQPGHDHHGHTHDHHDCLACAALERKEKSPGTWLALAVGVVPCTGALLVLLFGVANNLLFPAILMVGAISAGMAIAMSGIGVLAILGRRVALRRMKADDARAVRFTCGLRIAGAALVLLIGSLLFGFTFSSSQPLVPLSADAGQGGGQSPVLHGQSLPPTY